MKAKSTFGWVELIKGIVFLMLGIATLSAPDIAFSSIIVFFGVIVTLFGISDLRFYFKLRSTTNSFDEADSIDLSNAPLVVSIANIAFGILLILNPIIGQWIMNLILPLWFIMYCASRIINYSSIKKFTNSTAAYIMLWLSIVGLLIGILMFFNPLLFTMSVGVLIAISFLLIGLSNVIEALSALSSAHNKVSVLR